MKVFKILPFVLALCLLAGCAKTATDEEAFRQALASDGEEAQLEAEPQAAPLESGTETAPEDGELEVEDEEVPLAAAPMLLPVAAGTAVEKGGGAEIDYSNVSDGYVMARFSEASSKRIRVQVAGPATTYTYDLPTGTWVTYPLSEGNGSYKITVLQNTTGKKYAILASVSLQVKLTDEFAPFLRPNQYVDYSNAKNTVKKAVELTAGVTDPLEKVAKIYDYVVANLTYDKGKAASVQSGYLPVLDTVLSTKKGICFDYASLMAGMLRSQGVPCKLVVGYAGTAYHAWINVWTEETGWVDGVIYFDGTTWQRMDPTFASSGKGNEAIMKYIGDGSNYKVKYLY